MTSNARVKGIVTREIKFGVRSRGTVVDAKNYVHTVLTITLELPGAQ